MRGLVLLWWAVAYCWRRHAATIKPSSEHTQPPQAQTNTEDTDQQQLPPETSPWTQTTPWDQPTLHAPAVPGLQLQLRAAASTPTATQADAPVQTQPDDQEQCGSHGGTPDSESPSQKTNAPPAEQHQTRNSSQAEERQQKAQRRSGSDLPQRGTPASKQQGNPRTSQSTQPDSSLQHAAATAGAQHTGSRPRAGRGSGRGEHGGGQPK